MRLLAWAEKAGMAVKGSLFAAAVRKFEDSRTLCELSERHGF